MNLEEIKLEARNRNKNDLFIVIEMLCDYLKELEIKSVKPQIGEPLKEDIKKKGIK